ncbi:coiled coil domain-containing protein [Legionella gratiana]|uniref:Coiled coil domain protein n=1 Tax=Legionella gratiana TaxID=45066 RepID=A0A378J973_9GAMM|nr:hypothetical protein [Legionella gratiana]KTD10697.1 coiled coil domain-containing protein [Legionella gratiana]STX43728.1 coiled coil domain protein [Legionella gratiana]
MTFRKGVFDFLDSRKILRELTPEAEKAHLQKFRHKIGLSEFDFQTTAFNNHDHDRVRDYTGFKVQIGEDKENTFNKLLQGKEPEKIEIQEAFKRAFQKEEFYDKAKESYNASMLAFKDIMQKVPDPYSVQDITDELIRIQTNARNAIAAQQKIELERFKKEIESQTPNLKIVSNIDDEDKIKEIKDKLIKDLENTHKTQLDAFDTATKANESLLTNASKNQMELFILAAQLEKYAAGQSDARKRQEMYAQIEAARQEMQKRLGKTPEDEDIAIGNISDSGMNISAIDPKDLQFIYTLTGKKIEQKKPGLWTIEFSPRIFDPGYYLSYPANQEKPKADMIAMAQMIRAAGFNGIKMTVDFPNDPYTEKLRLKQAYEACLEAGFPPVEYGPDGKPKKPQRIVLIDSKGREVNINELFKDDGPKLSALHEQAKQRKIELDSRKDALVTSKKSPPEITNALKSDLHNAKYKGKSEEEKRAAEKDEKQLEERVDKVLKGP